MKHTANGRPISSLPSTPSKFDPPAGPNTPQTSERQQRRVRRSTRLIPIGMSFKLQ